MHVERRRGLGAEEWPAWLWYAGAAYPIHRGADGRLTVWDMEAMAPDPFPGVTVEEVDGEFYVVDARAAAGVLV